MRLEVEQTQFEHGEETDRPRTDDDDIGGMALTGFKRGGACGHILHELYVGERIHAFLYVELGAPDNPPEVTNPRRAAMGHRPFACLKGGPADISRANRTIVERR